jgi:glycosyltransferase involved in cell wall biosynthesis
MTIKERYEKGFNPDEEYLGRDKEVNRIEPLVSVCTATYQHRDYIEDCIEGILMQETDFPVEIIIGEDESTDGTREICKQYAEEHPDKIRLFLRDRQTSCMFDEEGKRIRGFNGMWTRKSARGKYIAMCEGDDYWTDPLKLQKQVDFMEGNEDYNLCVGGFKSINVDTGEEKQTIRVVNKRDRDYGYTFIKNDITKGWITKTLTSLFRREAINDMSINHFYYSRDVHLFYHILRGGKGFYFTEVFGIYRIHSEGIFSLKAKTKKLIDSYYIYKELYKFYYDEPLRIKYMGVIKGLIRERIRLAATDLNYRIILTDICGLIKTPMEFLSLIKACIPVVNRYSFRNRVSNL